MLRYCIHCENIFGCKKEGKKEKECIGCNAKSECPKDMMYPKEKLTVDICYSCSLHLIQNMQKTRNGNKD